MSELQGKYALVTGGAAGIGEGIARAFAAQGAKVAIADLQVEKGSEVATDIGGLFFKLNVTSEDDWQGLVADLGERWGRLDVLVNNAGVGDLGEGATPETTTLSDWRRYFTVNVEGTFLGCRDCLPLMREHGGSIINMSSVAALVPVPFHTAYAASKAAVYHYTQSLALHCLEQGYKIRCNTIHPGQIKTAMTDAIISEMSRLHNMSFEEADAMMISKTPCGEWGTVEDIAEGALYLASDKSRYMTGDRLVIDGGIMLGN